MTVKSLRFLLFIMFSTYNLFSAVRKKPQTIKVISDPKGFQPKKQASGRENTL